MPRLDLGDYFKNGLRPEPDTNVNDPRFVRLKNLKPTSNRTLVGPEPMVEPGEVEECRWPYPQAYKGQKAVVTFEEGALWVNGISTKVWDYGSASSDTPGVECCASGTFSDATKWTLGSGWAIDAGKLLHQTSAVALAVQDESKQAVALEAGVVYRVAFTLSGVTAGSVRVGLGTALSKPYNANGSYVVHLKAQGPTPDISFTPAGGFVGYIDNVSVRNLTEASLAPVGGLWQWMDFGEAWWAVNDTNLVVKVPSLAAGEPVGMILSDGALAGTGCSDALGRGWLGGLTGARFQSSEFEELFALWKASNTSGLTTTQTALDASTLFYTAPWGGDAEQPFMVELALLGYLPRAGLAADLLALVRGALASKRMGFVTHLGCGDVLRVVALGGGVAVYGTKAVWFVSMNGDVPQGVEVLPQGLLAKGAVTGDIRQHTFLDTEGVVWTLDASLQATRLGYKEFTQPLVDGLTGEGANALTDDWLLMEGWTAFEGGLAHAGGTAPVLGVTPTAVAEVNEIDWYTAAKATSYDGTELTDFMVPLPVFFEGWKSEPRKDIVNWVWNFGDGSADFSGFNAAHIYETPGTYTVTLTAHHKDGGTSTDTLTVVARERVGRTFYVDSATGSDTNDGLSEGAAWKTATKAFRGMVDTVYRAGDRILFNRGQTFDLEADVVKPWAASQKWGYYFGAYGSGDKPIIKHVGTSTAPLIKIGYNGLAWWGCVDLDFDCRSATGQVSSCFIATARCMNIFFLRCDIHNHKQAFGMNGDHLTRKMSNAYLIGCHIYDSIGIDAMHLYTKCARYANISNTFGFCDDHVGYHSYLNKAIFALNTYDEWAFGRLCIRSCGVTDAANPTNNVHIIGNTFTGWIDPVSDTWAHTGNGIRYNLCAVELGPNVGRDQWMEWAVVEWNTFTNVEKFIEVGDWEHVTIRHNTMTTVAKGAGNPRIQIGHPYEHRPVYDVEIYANDITSEEDRLGTAAIFWVGWYGWTGTPYSPYTVHTDINIHHNRVTALNGDARMLNISTQSAAQIAQVTSDWNVLVGAVAATEKLYQLGGNYVTPQVTLTLAEWQARTGNDLNTSILATGSSSSMPTLPTTAVALAVDAGSAYQPLERQAEGAAVRPGQAYRVTATLRGCTAGSVSLSLGGTVVVDGWAINETRSWDVRCGTASGTFEVSPTVDFNGSLFDLTVTPLSVVLGAYDPLLGDRYFSNGVAGVVLTQAGLGETTVFPTALYRLGKYLYGYSVDLGDREILLQTEEFDMGTSDEKLVQLIELGAVNVDNLKAGMYGRVDGTQYFGDLHTMNPAGQLYRGMTAKVFALVAKGTWNPTTRPKIERATIGFKQVGKRGRA